jgi:hypothetical protein
MSPYLHFGQISPLYLALDIWRRRAADRANAETYFEELVVRRELSMNFVEFTDNYDTITCMPEWAKKLSTITAAMPGSIFIRKRKWSGLRHMIAIGMRHGSKPSERDTCTAICACTGRNKF